MWQFMKGTAKQYGLAVGRKVDERKNPARATDAAVEYLSSLHDRLGSWYLAAAAYNSGEGTVLKAMKRVLGRTKGSDEDFFAILPSLPRETQDYVPKLIAATRVGNAPEQYGVTPVTKPVTAPVVTPKVIPTRAKLSHKSAVAKRVHKSVKPRSAHRRRSR
jgi:membrane-bound lytic murein transglycosylase D